MAGMSDAYRQMMPLFKDGKEDLKKVREEIQKMLDATKAEYADMKERGKPGDGYLHGMMSAFKSTLQAISAVEQP